MIPKKHILQYLEVDFNILPMISTIYDQLKIHTMECLRPQRWSGGTGGTEVPPALSSQELHHPLMKGDLTRLVLQPNEMTCLI